MNKLLAIAAMVGCLAGPIPEAQANPANDRVRVAYVFTPNAAAKIGNTAAVRSWIQARTLAATDYSIEHNGGNTRYENILNEFNDIAFNADCCSGAFSQNGNAVGKAAKNIAVNELRDKYNADVVVVVTSNQDDSSTSSLMDCTKTGAAAAPYAFVGMDIYGTLSTDNVNGRIAYALGKAQCADENDAYAFMNGHGVNNCNIFNTVGSDAASVGPKNIWMVTENGLTVTPGYSETGSDHANTQMAVNCNGHASGVFTYTCAATGTCSAPGGNQFCYHNRTQTDTRGLPTCTPGSSDPNASPPGCITTQNIQSPWSVTNFTCTKGQGTNSFTFYLPYMSNPNRFYLGMPRGSSTKNAVGDMNARFGEAKLYYQVKLAPMLKAAVQKAQEEAKK